MPTTPFPSECYTDLHMVFSELYVRLLTESILTSSRGLRSPFQKVELSKAAKTEFLPWFKREKCLVNKPPILAPITTTSYLA